MVENGFANYYFYSGKDKYSDDLLEAWNKCIQNDVNLCEKSECKKQQAIIIFLKIFSKIKLGISLKKKYFSSKIFKKQSLNAKSSIKASE